MKPQTAKYRGQYGEKKALLFLKENHFKILEKNYISKFGEIDIIAQSPESSIHFIEVKTYLHKNWVHPLEMIKKQYPKIKKTAQIYLQKKHMFNQPLQIDAIIVSESKIDHIQNI